MKKITVLLFILFASCYPLTTMVNESQPIGEDFEIKINKFSDVNQNVTARFNGKEGKYTWFVVTIKNNGTKAKKLDFNKFYVENSLLEPRIPIYDIVSSIGWDLGDRKKVLNFYGGETKNIRMIFITPAFGKINAVFYEEKRIELKYGETKQRLL